MSNRPRKRRAPTPRRNCERLEERQMLAADLANALELLTDDTDETTAEVASIDGTGNNVANPEWGSTGAELLRITTVEYADDLGDPAGGDRPSARLVSNAVADQPSLVANERYLTDFVWLWGQFIDHDITLSHTSDESLDIEVPAGDADFDPMGLGGMTIAFTRSEVVTDEDGVRQQTNAITAYIDGSAVYGSDEATAAALREGVGGRMRVSDGDLLPIGDDGFFMAGDVRANENVLLTSMHTLWVREHNRLADEIAADPSLTDEQIFQQARALVTAQIQAITYNEWLPALLGPDAIGAYDGYDPSVNASIANIFSTAAYRFGHSMLSTDLLRLDADGEVVDEGNLSLSDAFFSPDEVLAGGIDTLLRGAAAQVAQEIDNQIVDDVRNFLFGPPGADGLDLASLNIQRGRDHGLPDYNQAREDMGLAHVTSFDQITSDTELATKLAALYGAVDNIDVWVGILAEDHVPGASLGELGRTILIDQFLRIRDGDRFWYENVFSGRELRTLQSTSLSDVIERNTDVESLQQNVFYDASVLYYSAGARGVNATVAVRGDALEVVDNRSGRALASVPVDEANKVVLVGSARRGDRFTVAPSVEEANLPGGVVIDGQGGRDRVTVRGGRAPDTMVVDGAFMAMNGMTMQIDDAELLTINGGFGPDDITVTDDGGMRVVVSDARFDRFLERLANRRQPTFTAPAPANEDIAAVDAALTEPEIVPEGITTESREEERERRRLERREARIAARLAARMDVLADQVTGDRRGRSRG